MTVFTDFMALRDKLVTAFDVPQATVTSTARTSTMADRIAGNVTTSTTTSRTVPALIGSVVTRLDTGEIVKTLVVKCFGAVAIGETITLGSTSGEIASVQTNDPTGAAPYTWVATLK